MGFITYLLCLPVRALLYVLLKPPLLVYALIKYCVLSIVSVAAYYLGRLAERVKMLWNWTHRLSLPWWSRPCTAKGTQTLEYREEVLDLSAVPHISPSLGLEPGHARRDLALARRRRPPIWRQQLSERLGQSRVELSRREALASLITLLLQPMSPPDSDSEEEEKATTAAYMEEEEETKRALQLILDLVRISKSHTDASSSSEAAVASLQQAADVAAMRRHARDCEKLQNLISELDRLAVEVDPASLLHRRRPRRREDRRERSRSGSPCHPLSPSTEEGQVSSEGTTEYQEANTSLDTDTDQFTEANEGYSPDLQEGEGEEESDILDQAAHMESQRSTHAYPTQLSPVQESPEYSRRSTSVESISHLESDLNTALSRLDTETSDLRVDEDVLASFESQMGRERPSRPATTHSQAGGNTSLSSQHSTTGSVSTEGDVTVSSTSLSQSEDVFEDCSEDFSTIPTTPPSLGLKEGHDRRDLAVARSSSKRRPPTRRTTTHPKQTSEVVSDKQSEDVIVEEEEEEMDENENRKLDFVPTLTDQVHLLKPGFPMPSDPDEESESTLASSTNLTEPETTPTHSLAIEKETTPTHSLTREKETTPTHSQASKETTPTHSQAREKKTTPTHSQAREKDVSVESRRQGSAEPEPKAAQEPSLHIPSSEPPWIEMRRKSKDTPPPPVPPSLEKPPKVPMLEPDEKDSEDSIYDTLEPLETRSHEAVYETLPITKYLHQTIAEQQQQKQESPHPSPSPHPSTSPQLPPRNPTHVVEEREGRSRHRHSSRHHSSSSPSERPSTSSKEKDRHGSESSRKHRSHSSDRERRSSSSRHSSSDKHSTDKHSSSHSRSREHSSSHSERHSDKHRSHSSEKHSHGSSKSRDSDGKKKVSNPAKVKDSPKEEGKKHSSSLRDTSKSKSESSRSKSGSSKSKSESSKSSKSKAAEKTPEKSSKSSSRASSLKASSTPPDEEALMKSTSLTSLNSVRSQRGSNLVLESGKETEV